MAGQVNIAVQIDQEFAPHVPEQQDSATSTSFSRENECSRKTSCTSQTTIDKKIEVVGVDGSGRTTITNCTGKPLGLTMDLKERLLIYSQHGGSSAGIWKVNLDGSGHTQIVPTGVNDNIYSLSINYNSSSKSSSRLCWSNYVQKHIQCCDYFGNNPQVYNVTGDPLGLAVENDVAYYSQSNPNSHGLIQLKTGNHTNLNWGSYGNSYTSSMAYLLGECSMSRQPADDTPVQTLKGDIHHLLGGDELIS
ncbi:hypothetical protein LSAT2_031495 [Lamellibrachia satsuma]|nr:hypothetical protein LSAT2_031495 [Lamellibrachia satsuma]